jgi:hypothetical protein
MIRIRPWKRSWITIIFVYNVLLLVVVLEYTEGNQLLPELLEWGKSLRNSKKCYFEMVLVKPSLKVSATYYKRHATLNVVRNVSNSSKCWVVAIGAFNRTQRRLKWLRSAKGGFGSFLGFHLFWRLVTIYSWTKPTWPIKMKIRANSSWNTSIDSLNSKLLREWGSFLNRTRAKFRRWVFTRFMAVYRKRRGPFKWNIYLLNLSSLTNKVWKVNGFIFFISCLY